MARFAESTVEDATLAWFEELGYAVLHGPDIAAGEPAAERSDPEYRDVVLEGRLRQALVALNPALPSEALDDAYRKLTRTDAPSLVERNRAIHKMLVDGVNVEYRRHDGSIAGAQARVIDFEIPDNNDWLAVNQFTVAENQHTRRPDVVLFVNGLPLAVIELKNPADGVESADRCSGFGAKTAEAPRHRCRRTSVLLPHVVDETRSMIRGAVPRINSSETSFFGCQTECSVFSGRTSGHEAIMMGLRGIEYDDERMSTAPVGESRHISRQSVAIGSHLRRSHGVRRSSLLRSTR